MNPIRNVFEKINAKLPKGTRPFEGFLRLESADLGTQKSINFYISKDSSSQTATETENRLAKTDAFVATTIGFGLIKTTTATQTRNSVIHTFANGRVFNGTAEEANLTGIYNGLLTISVDGVINVPSFPMIKFLRTGGAQQDVLTAATGTGNAFERSQWDANTFPYYPLASYLTFNGASNVEITVNCPVSQDLAATGGTGQNKLVMFIFGVLIQNGASYNTANLRY